MSHCASLVCCGHHIKLNYVSKMMQCSVMHDKKAASGSQAAAITLTTKNG